MAEQALAKVPSVDIDDKGVFKYILIKIVGKENADGSEPSKIIVRGYADCKWHGKPKIKYFIC